MKKIIYVTILILVAWGGILYSRYAHSGYIRDLIDGYLVDYSVPVSSSPNNDNEDIDTRSEDQKKLDNLRRESRDSIVTILLTKSLQERECIIQVIHELMSAEPAVLGVDIIFDNLEDSKEYAPEILSLPFRYPNLVLAYSLPNEREKEVTYPLGITSANEVPNLGYTNFGLKGKEVRYLNTYSKIDRIKKPAFWTQMWVLSHPDKLKNNELWSGRRFINYNLHTELLELEINSIDKLHEPYALGYPSPLEVIKGKMVLLGWKGDEDIQIVPIHDGIHTMPGIELISTALNTIVLNELDNCFFDKYRNIFISIILIIISILFVLLRYTKFYKDWSNVIQLVLGIIMFYLASFLPLTPYEVWSFFGALVVFVLIAPATDDIVKNIFNLDNDEK